MAYEQTYITSRDVGVFPAHPNIKTKSTYDEGYFPAHVHYTIEILLFIHIMTSRVIPSAWVLKLEVGVFPAHPHFMH